MPKFNTSEWSNLGAEWGEKGDFEVRSKQTGGLK